MATAQRASAYLRDPRVRHFWDLWKFGSRTFSKQLGIPELDAWDMFTFYKPHLTWGGSMPDPTFWMQNRGLKFGQPYSKDALEAQMKDWLQ
ncbi:MAG: hypothetical protein JSU96_19705 [Acidobacteriota bacterium]|nr:MAG: hypothetical protein JSU96_19705 [Acidobacteriota bacterium]